MLSQGGALRVASPHGPRMEWWGRWLSPVLISENQKWAGYHFTVFRIAVIIIITTTTTTRTDWLQVLVKMGNQNPHTLLVEMQNWYSHFVRLSRSFLGKLNIFLPWDPPILGIYLMELKIYIHTKTCTWMFMAVLFIIAKTWKQPQCPSVGEWIKLWYMQTVQDYSALKRHEGCLGSSIG